MHKYYASRKRARLRWRHSDKGRAWDTAYYQRDEVKKSRNTRPSSNRVAYAEEPFDWTLFIFNSSKLVSPAVSVFDGLPSAFAMESGNFVIGK